jgi:tetratricopeptide (TPR) repeat protein
MKRHDRAAISAVAALTAVCSLHLVPSESIARAAEPQLLATLLDGEQAAEPRFQNPPVPKPQRIADWGLPPSDRERATTPEEDLRATLADSLPTIRVPKDVSRADRDRAAELFREARQALDAGSPENAARLLRDALRLDPNAAEVWVAFAGVLADQANPIGAKSAYSEALSLGARDFETLVGYGLLSARFREDDQAIAALSLASQVGSEDPGARFVLAYTLAEVLARRGYLAAATARYAELLDLPDAFNEATNYRQQLNEVYRNRRDALLRAAETSHSMGQWRQVDRFLDATTSIPGPAHPEETALRCYVLVQTGRPARAAKLLVSDFGSDPPGARTIELFGYLAEHTELGPTLDRAIRDRAEELPDELRQSARQSITLARAAVASGEDAGKAILLEHFAGYPTDRAVWLELLRTEPAEAISRMLGTHPGFEPDVSAVALRLHGEIGADPGTAIVIRSALRAGNFALAPERFLQTQPIAATDDGPHPPVDPTLLSLGVELLVDAGRGVEADRMLDAALEHAASPAELLATARALLERGRLREAAELLDRVSKHAEVRSGDEILAGRIATDVALALGDRDAAIRIAQQSLRLNPGDFDAAVLLARETDRQEAVQRLRTIPGAESELDRIRARTAIEREQYDLAERLLRSAWDSPLPPAGTAQQLISLWVQTGSVDRAEQWLLDAISELPDRTELTALLASLRRADRRPEDALDSIATAMMNRPGSAALSRELEALLRNDFDATDRWLSQARARLSNAPDTFSTFIERAEVELAARHVDQAISLAELAADLAPDLRPGEQASMNSLLEGVSREIINRPRVRPETVAGFVRVFDRLDAPTDDAWRGRISVASIDRASNEDDLVDLALRAGNELPDFREDAFIHAAQAIIVSSRTGQSMLEIDEARQAALVVYSEATRRLSPYPSRVLGDWIDFTQQIQDPFALGEAIRSLGDRQGPQDRRLLAALNYQLLRGSPGSNASAGTEMLAENASYLASQLSLNDQFETAKFLYEEILRIKPDHIETNNSYGFRLLEAGEQVDRAIRMIEFAYGLAPNEAHIIDSMGWARYKQGRLQDEVDPATGLVRPGAVSLLRRAKTLSLQVDPIGLNTCYTANHLGDALWASGQTDQAVQEWELAGMLAAQASKGIRGTSLPLSIEVELQELIERVGEKVRAASEDRAPEIAPQLD